MGFISKVRIALPIILISSFIAASLPADFVFAQSDSSFNINPSFDVSGRTKVNSTLIYTAVHSEIYIEESFYQSFDSLEQSAIRTKAVALAQTFDNTIYPRVRQVYGMEWTPGIDNNARIIVLLTPMQPQAGGYIRTVDETLRTVDSTSNEHEMVYLDSKRLVSGDDIYAYLAHEFAHLVIYNQKNRLQGLNEETWLNEAMAEYAPTAVGLNIDWDASTLQDRVADFQHLPFDSLLEWQGTNADAGSASLFMHYLAGRFGEGIILNILHSSRIGIEAVNDGLAAAGSKDNFDRIFTDWAAANYVNGSTSQDDTKYSYIDPNLNYQHFHVAPVLSVSLFSSSVAPLNFSVKSWESQWYRFVPGELGSAENNIAKFEFNAPDASANFVVPYIVANIMGQRSLEFMTIVNGRGVAYVPDFGTSNLSVSVSPINEAVRSGSRSFPATSFLLSASLVDSQPDSAKSLPDGALIRATGGTKVFVINNGYKRWIQSADIMNMYGHLKWENIISVPQETVDAYPESFLVQKIGDYHVYEVTTNGSKKWLNITAAEFDRSGRSWDAIFAINERELGWYR